MFVSGEFNNTLSNLTTETSPTKARREDTDEKKNYSLSPRKLKVRNESQSNQSASPHDMPETDHQLSSLIRTSFDPNNNNNVNSPNASPLPSSPRKRRLSSIQQHTDPEAVEQSQSNRDRSQLACRLFPAEAQPPQSKARRTEVIQDISNRNITPGSSPLFLNKMNVISLIQKANSENDRAKLWQYAEALVINDHLLCHCLSNTEIATDDFLSILLYAAKSAILGRKYWKGWDRLLSFITTQRKIFLFNKDVITMFSTFKDAPELNDVQLFFTQIRSQENEAHVYSQLASRTIFASKSDYFRSLFGNGMKQTFATEVEIIVPLNFRNPGIDIFEQFHQYFYTYQMTLTPENVYDVVKLADYWQMKELLRWAAVWIEQNLKIEEIGIEAYLELLYLTRTEKSSELAFTYLLNDLLSTSPQEHSAEFVKKYGHLLTRIILPASIQWSQQIEVLKGFLECCPNIEYLTIENRSELPKEAHVLIGKLSRLKGLELAQCVSLSDELFAACHSTLDFLKIRDCSTLSKDSFAVIGKLSALKTLDLARCKSLADEELKCFTGLNRLERFYVSYSQIIGHGFACLSHLPIKEMHLGASSLFDGKNLVHFKAWKDLWRLRLFQTSGVNADTSHHLAKLVNLSALDVQFDYHFNDQCLQHFRELKRLNFLNLTGNSNITDAGFVHLEGLPLEHLYVRDCIKITNEALKSLGKITTLHTLDLSGCKQITIKGLLHLQSLSLKEIQLDFCRRLGNNALKLLGKIPTLEALDFSHYKSVNAAGYAGLAKSQSLKKLAVVNSKHINVASLPHIFKIPTLEELNIKGSPFVDDQSFDGIDGARNLKYLNIRNCNQVTQVAIAKLREQAGLTVFFD